MKYQTAVGRLRSLAKECPRANVLTDDPLIVGAYVFGDLLDGKDDLQVVHLALVINMPTEELTCYADPPETQSIASFLRLGKLPLDWYLRPVGPEDYLWRAAHGYLDLHSAVEARSAV